MPQQSKEQITKLLPWDSNFFGFQVACLLSRRADHEFLASTLNRMWKDGVKLVYWASDPTDTISQKAATISGGLLVDRKYLYTIDISLEIYSKTENSDIEEMNATSGLNDDLSKLALQCGTFSRFHVDPKFPNESWEALYIAWMKNSINGSIADAVLIKKELDCISGVITLRINGDLGTIGLLGVDEKYRNQGIGRKLIFASFAWFKSRGIDKVEVLTQGDNTGACRFYESCGFTLLKTDNFYHFWNPIK